GGVVVIVVVTDGTAVRDIGGAGAEESVDQCVGTVLVRGAALPMLDVLAVSGGFGASGPFLGDLLAGRVLQEVEDRRGLQRRQVCAELGHPVGAAAELHSAVPERGFTPGGHALRIVLVDDGVGLV